MTHANAPLLDQQAITEFVAQVLAPRPGLPAAETVEEWLQVLRGHIAYLVPIVEDAAPAGWQEAVHDVRAELDTGPGHHLAAATVHAQVLARYTGQLLGLAGDTGERCSLPGDMSVRQWGYQCTDWRLTARPAPVRCTGKCSGCGQRSDTLASSDAAQMWCRDHAGATGHRVYELATVQTLTATLHDNEGGLR
ncbi:MULTISPECIES: DUF6415 family natural product biosynthesis protein [unclassified Streptomyces]|uniref:DUF6415 family natural product biosynthesis protein n=1 Tax=unclassified Streptomyces TaxID=2593676 RepID=UPI00382216F2